ncbi:imidazolonepropionase-like amidohydrolase [Bacillus oleivorans]|uniref:Imidazolonepropionase-like amidohydrolase n=1 Tax=Bacillus oleivorans TaxID=1448271 RepID=A0A285CPK6_9BACI|nr:amidohydrolase family protein [Bacillus oleivorans]SNX69454.1 imidazolonepropionase-like amidohydrolase [Bacillus oleivorans]
MDLKYIVKSKRLVTVSKTGTIHDGAMSIENGRITAIGPWETIKHEYHDFLVIDYSNHVITPSLVDCHTHLLEFAPTSLYPVTPETHFHAGKAILLTALSAGITALGEQVCGHPLCDFSVEDYRRISADFPMDICFATTSISIGFEKLAHFTSFTKSQSVRKEDLVDSLIVRSIAMESDYPGENIFINATPANFTIDEVPRAGEIIYSLEELKQITEIYHAMGKQIGAHVAGEEGIKLALEAQIDVLHHAHGITAELMNIAAEQGVKVVATPMGGTHLPPNSPEEILRLVEKGIPVSIATDAYLPPYMDTSWLPFTDQSLRGPDVLMLIASPSMVLMKQNGFDENEILALITANPAELMGKEQQYGRLQPGTDASFIVSNGVPGLEITDVKDIKCVYYKGVKVIERANS